jgi:hypothetical protein
VGVLPAIACAALVVWQLVLAGHAAWLCATAASAGARAAVVGRDPEPAVRAALPDRLERDLRVELTDARAVRVRLRVPLAVPGAGAPVRVSATTALGAPPS